MKRYKNLNTKLNILKADATSKTSLIGFGGFNFSKKVASKYAIFRKSINLPVLIFLRLFGTKVVNRITNISRLESINNYFRLQHSFYLRMISQLNQTLSNYPLLPAKISNYVMPNLLLGKVQGGKGIAQSAKKGSTAEIASLLLTMTGREAEKGGVDGLFGWQNKNILRAKITDKYLQFAEMKINARKANISTLKNYTDLSPDMIYPVRGNIYQDSSAIEQEKTLSGLKNSINNINNKTTELILRKPVAQSSNIASEIKENLQRERATSIKIHDSVIKDSSKTNPINEINIIADNVYKIIEKRISIERERRGAF
ncbi:MAG: hypothetical protein HW382_1151 [Deltaproteobacteria bacterium]|nr:hypothetical protein [Deltaproteobacteria bacterium]